MVRTAQVLIVALVVMGWLSANSAALPAAVDGSQSTASPATASRASIDVPAMPTGIAVARDGTVYVSAEGRAGVEGLVVAYRRSDGMYREVGRVTIDSGTQDVTLTPDGRVVLIAARIGVAVVEARAFASGRGTRVHVVRDVDAPKTNRIARSADGAYAFYTNQAAATLGVARLERRPGARPRLRIISHVKLDRLPGGVALSPDGSFLYVTSEIDNVDPKSVRGARDPRLSRERCASNLGPHGVLSVVDTRLAVHDPLHAVVARIAAGCAPVRVALSPLGDTAWVTVQGEDRLLAFDTAALRDKTGGAAALEDRALLADVHVGEVPVGAALSTDGRILLVANSHRSADRDDAQQSDLTVVNPRAALQAEPAVAATLPTGALAREVVAGPDGTFLVTNYRARKIDIVTPPRL